jgi:integrase/recombinase XerD
MSIPNLNTKPSNLSILKQRFLEHLRMKNATDRTVEQWNYVLLRFLEWCDERGIARIDELTVEIARAYRRYLFHYRNARTGKPLTTATQASYLVTLRGFVKWLWQEKLLAENLAVVLEVPRMERRLPEGVLSADEVESILSTTSTEKPLGIRDRAMLETFYSTTIRCNELRNLQTYDVGPARRVLRVRQGKGQKDRVVPIGVRALRWVLNYTENIRPILMERVPTDSFSHTLFVSFRGLPFNRTNISALIRGYFDKAGITRPGSCHLLRHTAATLMLDAGADIRSLQLLLGHEHLNTTQIYTHVSIGLLQDVHAKTHPAEKKPESSGNDANAGTETKD